LKKKRKKKSQRRLSIHQIEAIMEREEEIELKILPSGEIQAFTAGREIDVDDLDLKPITMRENLGGEYAFG